MPTDHNPKTFRDNFSILNIAFKEKGLSYTLFDVGVLGAMLNLSPKTIVDYDYGSYKGYFAENIVLNESISALSSRAIASLDKMNTLTNTGSVVECLPGYGTLTPCKIRAR